jgi:hypothetical protein
MAILVGVEGFGSWEAIGFADAKGDRTQEVYSWKPLG